MNDILHDLVHRTHDYEKERLERAANQLKWDKYWIKKAKETAEPSKDPSTKTGAVIIGRLNQVVGTGYNGFAIGVDDSPERYLNRELKYEMVVHCEVNAYIFSNKSEVEGATLYTWPFMSCSRCAAVMIQVGIARCVAPKLPEHLEARWGKNMEIARMQFKEAGVSLLEMEGIYEELTNESK